MKSPFEQINADQMRRDEPFLMSGGPIVVIATALVLLAVIAATWMF